MIDYNKNCCIIKAFGIIEEEVEKIEDLAKECGLTVDCKNDCLDWTIILENDTLDSFIFGYVKIQIENLLGQKVYSMEGKTLEECIVQNAIAKGIKFSIAESLTGGMIASRIVNVSGSSSIFYEGVVVYSCESKVRRLHVHRQTIENYGAVSKQTSIEMVDGLLRNKDITFALSTTGCAGPNSDDNDTPVGLVYVGLGSQTQSNSYELKFDGERNYIRNCTTNYALHLLLENIVNYK